MRRLSYGLVFIGVAATAGCKDNDIGQPCVASSLYCGPEGECPKPFVCDSATQSCADPTQTSFSTDAIECPRGVCLQMLGANAGLCTKSCEDDSDCERADTAGCEDAEGDTGSFVCVRPIVTAPVSCGKLCVCQPQAERNGIYSADGGVAVDPLACGTSE